MHATYSTVTSLAEQFCHWTNLLNVCIQLLWLPQLHAYQKHTTNGGIWKKNFMPLSSIKYAHCRKTTKKFATVLQFLDIVTRYRRIIHIISFMFNNCDWNKLQLWNRTLNYAIHSRWISLYNHLSKSWICAINIYMHRVGKILTSHLV